MDEEDYRKRLVKNIQMLATLMATATYAAAFNPPGGVWQDIHDATGKHLPGDPIMRSTDHGRYVVFFYSNAAAFAFSLAVVVLTLLVTARPEMIDRIIKKQGLFLVILMSLMLVAMLALAAAYGAGACHDKMVVVWYCVLVPVPLALFFGQIIMFINRLIRARPPAAAAEKDDEEEKSFGKLMVPLSMFALTITYVAGLSTPGGFWDNAEGGHRPGDAILKDRLHGRALGGFVLSNTFAFAASLYGAVISIVMRNKRLVFRSVAPNIILVVFCLLGGLLSAYCVGSSRGRSSITWLILTVTVASEVTLGYGALMVVFICDTFYKKNTRGANGNNGSNDNNVSTSAQADLEQNTRSGGRPSSPDRDTWITRIVSKLLGLDSNGADDKKGHDQAKLVQLMAGLAVAITYQAGLYPPGGLWPANADGHMAGDPILLTNYARRYRGFHYCNSVSFVASLLVMFLARKKVLHKHHALEAAMMLDMLGLIGAYAIGSCRDQVSTLYVVGLAGAAMVYVVLHGSYFNFTVSEGDDKSKNKDAPAPAASDRGANANEEEDDESVEEKDDEKMGGRFLLFAILVASITYQAGLTPPGGFLLKDDAQSGHLAGDPVLHYNYPRRYRTFIYFNSVSFMLSIVLILLLVNPKQYRPAMQSHALSVCSAVSYVCLMGAFAAGSTQHMKRSLHTFGIAAAAIFLCLLIPLLVCMKQVQPLWVWLQRHLSVCRLQQHKDNEQSTPNGSAGSNSNVTAQTTSEKKTTKKKKPKTDEDKETSKKVHLVTLAILVASATYPAGLDPPGGSWQSSSHGHDAGNSMMHDNRRQRYFAFFFSNTTSFLASIVLIHMLLPAMVRLSVTDKLHRLHELYRKGIKGLVTLQCLGFLVAYAAGSSRQWKTSVYTGALVFPVLAFVAIHVRLSTWRKNRAEAKKKLLAEQEKQRAEQEKQSVGKDDAQQTAQHCPRPCDHCSKQSG